MALSGLPSVFNAAAFFIDRHLTEGRGERTVFRAGGRGITYAALAERVNQTGNALADLGVEMEQRVLIALPDGPEFAATFWAVGKLGAVAVPVSPWLTDADYAFLLQDSRAKVAVVDGAVAPRIVAVRDRCPHLRAIVVVGRAPAATVGFEQVVGRASARLAPAATVPDDVIAWAYTSGSTGPPKAAVHPHSDLVAAADLVGVDVFGLDETDRTFSASKMFFSFGLGNSLLFPARVGGASVLEPERMDAERAFEVITRERPTVFFAVATLYGRMLQVPDAERRFDLSSLRLCVSSGEALPLPVFDAWSSRVGHELVDVVGSTEALHDFIANRPGKVRRGSCGQLVPGFEARLVDDAGQPVAAGAVGHLLIKGPTTAPCYWNRRELSRRTMLGEWLRTGDMMACDADGYFLFAGRADDMLKVAGQWVAPAEVEACLTSHPALVDAGVAGRPDAQGLLRPHAWVVVGDGVSPTPELAAELIAFARSRLPGYKIPQGIDFVAELPRTATGKLQRFRLRERR